MSKKRIAEVPASPVTPDVEPMSAAELMAKGGQINMLEGRSITIKTNQKPDTTEGSV